MVMCSQCIVGYGEGEDSDGEIELGGSPLSFRSKDFREFYPLDEYPQLVDDCLEAIPTWIVWSEVSNPSGRPYIRDWFNFHTDIIELRKQMKKLDVRGREMLLKERAHVIKETRKNEEECLT
ncbi:hypothetical protein PQX77_018105, partial [Marasmius sp. AFHP31]